MEHGESSIKANLLDDNSSNNTTQEMPSHKAEAEDNVSKDEPEMGPRRNDKCPYKFNKGVELMILSLVGNVPDMPRTCPRDKDMSANCEDIMKWPAIFWTFFT